MDNGNRRIYLVHIITDDYQPKIVQKSARTYATADELEGIMTRFLDAWLRNHPARLAHATANPTAIGES